MELIISAVVGLMTAALPLIEQAGASALIDNIIKTLIQIIPDIAQQVPNVVADVQNIIATLKSSSSVTPAQFSALETAEATLDAQFEAAATAAGDPAPATTPSS